MFTPYSVSTPLASLAPLSADALLVPIEEYGMPPHVAAALAGAGGRTARALKRWLLDLAEAPPVAIRDATGTPYEAKLLPRAWQGRALRLWMQDQRTAQQDQSGLTLRGSRYGAGVQRYEEDCTECVDAQALISLHAAAEAAPAGYATLLVSVRLPKVVAGPAGLRVSDAFEELHDVRKPEVDIKIVLDEIFLLPAHRAAGLGRQLARVVHATLAELLCRLEFLMEHAPCNVDLDSEVVSLAGARWVALVGEGLSAGLAQPQFGWSVSHASDTSVFVKPGRCLRLRDGASGRG